MANVVQFPGISERSIEEAAGWLARLDKGLADEDRAGLREWLDAEPVNRRALLEVAELWDELDVLAELSDLFPLEQPGQPDAQRRGGAAALRWAAAACFALLIIAAGFVGYELRFDGAPEQVTVQSLDRVFKTPVGERSTVRLPDGSAVTLNTDSEVKVAYASDGREVFLQRGEAHFDVAHDPSRPFNVYAGRRVVRAVGTAFNVRLERDGAIEVTVTDGQVRLAARQFRVRLPSSVETPAEELSAVVLNAGELARLDQPALTQRAVPQVVRLDPRDIGSRLAWQRGQLVIEGQPLDAMLAEFERYITSQFVLEGEALGSQKLSGTFDVGDVEGLLLALEEIGIASERNGDRIVLRPAR